MPAARKALRQMKKHLSANKSREARISLLRDQARKASELKDADKTKELQKQFQKAVDKAEKEGFLKKSAAARLKSRLAKAVAK